CPRTSKGTTWKSSIWVGEPTDASGTCQNLAHDRNGGKRMTIQKREDLMYGRVQIRAGAMQGFCEGRAPMIEDAAIVCRNFRADGWARLLLTCCPAKSRSGYTGHSVAIALALRSQLDSVFTMSRWKLRALIVLATMGAGLSEAGAQDDPLPPGALWRQGTTRLRHPGGVNSLAFAPAGKLVASGGDGAVRLWDSAPGKELAFCSPGDFPIYQLAFAPAGQTLAMGPGDGFFLYDVAARRLRRHSEHEALTVSFSRDGRFLAGSGSSV